MSVSLEPLIPVRPDIPGDGPIVVPPEFHHSFVRSAQGRRAETLAPSLFISPIFIPRMFTNISQGYDFLLTFFT
jgi:hypothetical protein